MSRSVLGALLILLVVAVLIALWAIVTGGDDDLASNGDQVVTTVPTALPIPTSTPLPIIENAATTPTPVPTAAPTPVPDGFEACGDSRSPIRSATYIVDTNTAPLNQRDLPSVDGNLVGAFDPGQSGLVFNGECIVNLADGYVWWQIDNGTDNVWIASSFVTAN